MHAGRLVIPAKAGIQFSSESRRSWIPAFAGMTAFSEALESIGYVMFDESDGRRDGLSDIEAEASRLPLLPPVNHDAS